MMALMICKECSKEVSEHAQVCPACGNPATRKARRFGWGAFAIGAMVLFFLSYLDQAFFGSNRSAPELTHAQIIDSQFSASTGAHRKLEQMIKRQLKDPASYQHIETRYGDKGDKLNVVMQYRAKNGLGGYAVQSVVATCSIAGEREVLIQ